MLHVRNKYTFEINIKNLNVFLLFPLFQVTFPSSAHGYCHIKPQPRLLLATPDAAGHPHHRQCDLGGSGHKGGVC